MRAVLLLAYNVLRLLTWPIWALWWRLGRPSARYIELNLRGHLEEITRPPSRIKRLLAGVAGQRHSVAEIRRACDQIVSHPKVEGLILRMEQLEAGYAVLGSLRAELVRLRQNGKRVVCYLPAGADQRELYVASSADRVLAMPHAGFSALGPAAARTYVAPLLDRIGLRVIATAAGRYKTAADPLLRDSMSQPDREQLEAIVTVMLREWIAALGSRECLVPEAAEALFGVGLFGADRARELGVIDGYSYDDELASELGLRPNEEPLSTRRYLVRSPSLPSLFLPLRQRPRIAVVRLVGTIGGTAARGGIDLHGTTAVLRRLAATSEIQGVILYIDSPGGSALVSELLHREVQQLNRRKPVVAWMGDVAASGGYYLACAARAIIAHPTTLTGSIGVVSLRPVVQGLMELASVRREVVSLTPFADMHSVARAPTAAEELLLQGETSRIYERFLEVVAQGRERTRDQIAVLAEGRVWSGRDAREHGLVDGLGGYREARSTLTALLGSVVTDDDPLFVSLPMREVEPSAPKPPAPSKSANDVLDALQELRLLVSSGERVFTYALGLPRLH